MERPREVSFTASKQTINAARSQLTHASLVERVRQGKLLLPEIGKERVGNRPDRCEPRVVKRRPKPYKHLRVPRDHGRHTFISHALAGWRTLAEVRAAAGHASLMTTSGYLHAAVDNDGKVGSLFAFGTPRRCANPARMAATEHALR